MFDRFSSLSPCFYVALVRPSENVNWSHFMQKSRDLTVAMFFYDGTFIVCHLSMRVPSVFLAEMRPAMQPPCGAQLWGGSEEGRSIIIWNATCGQCVPRRDAEWERRDAVGIAYKIAFWDTDITMILESRHFMNSSLFGCHRERSISLENCTVGTSGLSF